MNRRTIIIFISALTFYALCCMFLHNNYQANLYKEIKQEINNQNWSTAKDKLDKLGVYKDSNLMINKVNYHYYMNLGDENIKQKRYKNALKLYNTANEYNSNEKVLNEKIKHTKSIIAEIQVEQNKKKLEEEKKIKLEQQKIQQAKVKERQKHLTDIQPAITKTFYKIDFIEDKSLNARMYDFYVDYYLWIQLPYDAKEGAFKLAVLYAKLKTNEQYSDDEYLFSTKIRNTQTKSVLAEYTNFSGVKITP